jgi:hypothetical protein
MCGSGRAISVTAFITHALKVGDVLGSMCVNTPISVITLRTVIIFLTPFLSRIGHKTAGSPRLEGTGLTNVHDVAVVVSQSHVVVSCGTVMGQHHVALSRGSVMWQHHVALPRDTIMWHCLVAASCGTAMGQHHVAVARPIQNGSTHACGTHLCYPDDEWGVTSRFTP